jgi:hypothetical protein
MVPPDHLFNPHSLLLLVHHSRDQLNQLQLLLLQDLLVRLVQKLATELPLPVGLPHPFHMHSNGGKLYPLVGRV